MRAAVLAAVAALLSGCALPALPATEWAAVGAGFSFGTALVTFDTKALEIWNERNPTETVGEQKP